MGKATIHINRHVGIGTYRIPEIFPDLEQNPILLEIFETPAAVGEVFRKITVKVIERQTYMFVDNDDGTISIGVGHLTDSADEVLYLDIIHELVHVRQQREGLNLYDRSVAYVDRPTEIEAYEVAIKEARRIGLTDQQILDYLTVEWITPEEHRRLAERLDIIG